jgi:hypothetical protein
MAKELAPVDWPAIEPHYRAGILSLSALAREFHVSRPAIEKHARRHGWVRSLAATIHATADRMIADGAVGEVAELRAAAGLAPGPEIVTDSDVIDAGAKQLVLVRLEHRQDIAALRRIVVSLMRELSGTVDSPERFGMIYDALANPHEPAIDALRDMAALVASLPARTAVAKNLADALFRCIGLEREAYGLDTAGGADGRPTVIIKDYTGRGSPEAPPQEAIEQ